MSVTEHRSRPAYVEEPIGMIDDTLARHHPHRWRLHRAGITNVWFFYDTEFSLSGGRLVLRGTNGAGKSRALELLLPYLLDADRRRMDATGGGKVRLEDLMRAGGEEQANRLGYLWLELVRTDEAAELHYLTIGALIRFSRSTGEAKVWYFTTPLRVGHDLTLMDTDRVMLSREELAQKIGADRITDTPETHRERVRQLIFGLTGESGKERFDGLRQLLHTLRSPDVGNRIEEGNLPRILSEALPPLSEAALTSAGEQLDGLSETRKAQQRLEEAYQHVHDFLGVYRRYATGVVVAATDSARAAVAAAQAAAREAADRRNTHTELVMEHARQEELCGKLRDKVSELSATITGIKESKEYADARDLDERERRLEAHAKVVDAVFAAADTARQGEQAAVLQADARAKEAVAAAATARSALNAARHQLREAGVQASLPETVEVHLVPGPADSDLVRERRMAEPVAMARPKPATIQVVPVDLEATADTIRQVADVARQRGVHAHMRLEQATRLETQYRAVERAEDQASDAEQRAEEAKDDSDRAAEEWDRAARTLAREWQAWIASEVTGKLLADADWSSGPLAAVLEDDEALVRDASPQLLVELDHAAIAVARPVQERHTLRLAALADAEQKDAEHRKKLEAERDGLLAQRDPAPPTPPWVPPAADGVPLWRAVEFAPSLTEEQRAGLEAALLAAGLLTALVRPDGSITGTDGEVLISATGPIATRPLTEALDPDPASPLPADLIERILSRIALADPSHPVWVDLDGSWGNGPLTGRLAGTAARHIGAAARAATRAARLAEISAELDELTTAAKARQAERAAIKQDEAALDAHLRTAPRSQAVAAAQALAKEAARQAERLAATHRQLRETAARLRREWSSAMNEHQTACASFALPYTSKELNAVKNATALAAQACDTAASALVALHNQVKAHGQALRQVTEAVERRVEAEAAAENEWREWYQEEAEFAAVKQHIGAEAARIRAELREAEAELRACNRQLADAQAREKQLDKQAAAAEEAVRNADEKAVQAQEGLIAATEALSRRLALRGVVAAAIGQPTIDTTVPEVTPAAVEAKVRTILAALRRRDQTADENALIRAQQRLERELSGTFDVHATIEDGVRLVEIADAAGRRTIAEADAELRRKRDEGRAALTERERHVFTNFVLGGVAEELRRRLLQAKELIDAMNRSLATIRTSHGIGVKIRWNLADDADHQVARVRDLVMTAADVRSPEHTDELITILKNRVDVAFAADQTAGYATHLKAALDYRDWHRVEVIITGPEPGQERRISRRAKLSQGETRFVSYVTLFAAIDAYLTSLPDGERALRLILLDDAFAKVDDRTIGELMGLLVRLDIDFAMTGHALWGCYPQVPALDCYEVRRREGTAAITTHIHWDGHTRHLRAAR